MVLRAFFILGFLSAKKSFILGRLALAVAFLLNAFSLKAEQQKFCKRFARTEKRRAFLQRQKLPLLARESLSAIKNEETKTGLERILILKQGRSPILTAKRF
jgi:hypothetical protein